MMADMRSETMALLRELNEQKAKLVEEFSKKRDIVDRKIEAVQLTAQLLAEKSERPAEAPPLVDHLEIPADLKGMTQHEALKALAKSNGGSIRITEVVPVLRRYGILHAKKNAWNILYSVMQRKGGWERASPGEYRLVEQDDRQRKIRPIEVELGDSMNTLRDDVQ